jgi:glutamate racemase
LGDSINLVDTSDAVVRQLQRKLEAQGKLLDGGSHGSVSFISSKDSETLLKMAHELIQSDLGLHQTESQLVSAFR